MTKLANKTQSYDKAGNLTLAYSADRGTNYIYKYDHHNRLTGVYDSAGTTRKAAFTWTSWAGGSSSSTTSWPARRPRGIIMMA
jgi:YD repeat-containing protein